MSVSLVRPSSNQSHRNPLIARQRPIFPAMPDAVLFIRLGRAEAQHAFSKNWLVRPDEHVARHAAARGIGGKAGIVGIAEIRGEGRQLRESRFPDIRLPGEGEELRSQGAPE